jgi:hypothetical protein
LSFYLFRKYKTLANQYQLLVDQRQADIDRLTKSLEQKSLVVEQVEKTNQDDVDTSIFFLSSFLSKSLGSYRN